MIAEPAAPRPASILEQLGPRPRVAVLRASRLGDLICALPALHDLAEALPGRHLTLIALPMLRDLVRRVGFVDRFVPFPGYPGIAEQFFEPARVRSFFSRMQAEHFDLVVQMHGSGAYSNPFALMLGGRLTAGWVIPGSRAPLLAAALPYDGSGPEVLNCRALAAGLGAPPGTVADLLTFTQADHAAAERLVRDNPRPWILLHPWARDPHKVWPLGRYLQTAHVLTRLHGGTVFVLGFAEDRLPGRGLLAQAAPADVLRRLVDLTGRATLPCLAALIARADLFLGNDSGPAHISYALGVPSVTVFGGTDPLRWGPAGWPGLDCARHKVIAHPATCRPCEAGDCDRLIACLDEITVESVAEAGSAVLAAGPGAFG